MKKDLSQLLLKRIIFSLPFLALLFIIFVFFSISTLRIYFQSKQISLERKEKESALRIEKEKNKELEQKISKFQTERGIEKILREKFQIKKPGEEVVIILNQEISQNETDGQNNKNFWRKILHPFRNKISKWVNWRLKR